MAKFITAEQASCLIKDNMCVGMGGFSTSGAADSIIRAIGKRYKETNSPNNLVLVSPTISGDQKENGYGLSAMGQEGLITKIYTSRVGNAPSIVRLCDANKIAVFIFPMGIFSNLFRAQISKKPGVITNVGKYTFVDPRNEGGKMNQMALDTNENWIELITIHGEEYLFYKPIPMDACIIRASIADEAGNVTFSEEVLPAEQAEMAKAVRISGGLVIVQVGKVVSTGQLDPRQINLHNKMIDYIVVATKEEQPFTYADYEYRPELLQRVKVPTNAVPPMELGLRKVVARRGVMELRKGSLANLGLGISDGVAIIANEEGLSSELTLTIETGIFGGVPLAGPRMGAGVNAEAVMSLPDTFDIYDGGILDCAYLSFAETDEEGNVNVSKFGGKLVGPGGFVNISQNTKRIYFLGTFTVDGLKCNFADGKISIIEEGKQRKFKKHVEQITFSGKYAIESGQEVMYITERAVFELTKQGMTLIEIAPGIDLEKDILAHMDFMPIISPNLKLMDERIFRAEKMNLEFKK